MNFSVSYIKPTKLIILFVILSIALPLCQQNRIARGNWSAPEDQDFRNGSLSDGWRAGQKGGSDEASRAARSNFLGPGRVDARLSQDGGRMDVYFGIAVPASNQVVLKAFNKTLANISAAFTAGEYGPAYRNISLQPFFIELPENEKFSSSLLVSSCAALGGRRTAALAVLGRSTAAATAALAAAQAGLPVLRAAPRPAAFHTTLAQNIHPLEVRLETTAREMLHALRALLLHTHWHAFTVLADTKVTSSISLRKDLAAIINTPPLSPTILDLPLTKTQHALFRCLADVSRSTRGVIVLISDVSAAQRVLLQAKRLNMLDGHFVWLWIDTDLTTNRIRYSDQDPYGNGDQYTSQGPDPFFEIETERRAKGEKHAADHRERHASGKRIEDTDRFKRNDEIVQVVKEQAAIELILGDNKGTDTANQKTIDILNKGVNRSDRSLESYKEIENDGIKFMDTISAPMGSRPSFYNSNIMYKNINKSSETLSHSSNSNVRETDGQFRDQSGYNNHNFRNSIYENDLINFKSKEGVESSKIALQHKTNSIPPESINKFLHNHDEPNNEYEMYIKDTELLSDKRDFVSSSIKHSDFGVKFIDTSLNFKPTVKSLSVFSKLSSLNDAYSLPEQGVRMKEKRTERMWSFTRAEGAENPASPVNLTAVFDNFPVGLLALRPLPIKTDRQMVRGAVRAMSAALRRLLVDGRGRGALALSRAASCWTKPNEGFAAFSAEFVRELNYIIEDSLAGMKYSQDGTERLDKSLVANFEILNLVPNSDKSKEATKDGPAPEQDRLKWRSVGRISGRSVQLDTIVWPGGDIVVSGLSAQARSVFRVVTALSPPFVMESELDEDGQCLRGLPCHRVLTSDKDNLTLVFNEMETQERLEEAEEDGIQGSFFPHLKYQAQFGPFNDKFLPFINKYRYRTNCCYGLAMDLLENIAQELEFDFHLYIVSDGLFGTRKFSRKYVKHKEVKFNFKEPPAHGGKPDFRKEFRNGYLEATAEELTTPSEQKLASEEDLKWNGIVGDLVSGAAHMSFASLSISSARSEVIDYSAPYFYSGVSFLAAPLEKSEIPLLAFLLPFSPELWIAIFTSLNVTAIAVAIYEWLSPFGLNPWGRQRSKNFSMSSALWVMWGLLCGHLVAFKAPKSWPNKFLINVWGGFSVIFVASYTANIAALIAGQFFHNAVDDYNDRNLLTQRVGTPRASAAEYYVQRSNHLLWDHMKKYALADVEDGIRRLRNGSLDLLIADTPILDYYRATDHGCKLQRIGETFNEDTYAVGMAKGFPLKDSISALISKYSSNGYMDILQEKWYGGLPCFKMGTDYGIQPRPLGVAAVAGVFILLGVGMAVGCLILFVEHMFYRYTLPLLRHKPKGTIWRSRNIMFFSQKLYRFINCVELVSPHHAARELVHTLRQGQITSLFQKSVKRKEHEQRRRRKSKAQFFEMIQEIRRVQQEERDQPLEAVTEIDSETTSPTQPNSLMSPPKKLNFLSLTGGDSKAKSPLKSKLFSKDIFKSPRAKNKKRKQSTAVSTAAGGLNVRRFSTDSVFSSHSMLRFETTSVAIGRRLSKDTTGLTNSPPDINSRRSSYMDFANFGSRSPNVSCDSLEVGKKLATIPKYKGKHFLESSPSTFGKYNRNRPGLGNVFGQSSDGGYPLEARSFQNVSEQNENTKESAEETSNSVDDLHMKPDFPQSELQKKHKKTFEELQEQLNKRGEKGSVKTPVRRCFSQQTDANPGKTHHQIKIQIEDHSSPSAQEKHMRQRHKSLESEEKEERRQRPRTPECFPKDNKRRTSERSTSEQSEFGRDLHPPSGRSRSGSSTDQSCRSTCDDILPPAPPYPNVAPRNSGGKSPLERLTKDELVLLWRSSESELRSHLLTALREKENTEPP